ncbi:DNA topoisomerase 3-alpha-like [Camellia sinensis]|uniref:DNA topoisomerase 3-alpha-like n=1 Tax=Camellia sinensis TaxID=4442 RepID=UPI001035C4C5|nr:DNA topoisomerase 3-alpha-like [Camellia sinensis]
MASSSTNNSNIRLKPRLCNCGRTATIHIVRTNDNGNKGRLFFVCPSKYTETPKCNYFKFVDEDDEDVTSTIRSNTRASDGVTVEHFNELRRRL